MKKIIKIILLLTILTLTGSCVSLKPYERIYVDDPLMSINQNAGMKFNYYVQSIREGSTPAGSTKSSGGCGCN